MKRNVKQNNRSVGAVYEQAAGYYLEQNGYELIEYNYRCRDGEIDIIAKGNLLYNEAMMAQSNIGAVIGIFQ